MKKIFKYALLFAVAGTLTTGFTSCSSDDDEDDNKTGYVVPTDSYNEDNINNATVMGQIVDNYIKNVVEPTYADLAKGAKSLYDACQNLYAKRKAGTLTQTDIDNACEAFKSARKYWEQSEAFLYGAASDNEIDPHIDSWPLDHAQLVSALNSKTVIAGIKGENAAKFVYENNGNFDSVLGFHGLEFILFRNGANRTLAALKAEKETEEGLTSVNTEDECAFAAAVSGDLLNMISLLDYGWLGNKAGNDIYKQLDGAQWVLNGTRYAGLTSQKVSYGYAVRTAGTTTGFSTSWQEAMQNIFVGGCSNICQEVYTQKLGQAYRVATGNGEEEDAGDYIESPYSKRSFQDYQDNIYSIKHSLYGNRDDNSKSPENRSLMTFMKDNNYTGYNALSNALNDAIASLETAKKSGKAFIDAPGDAQVKNCIDKIQALDDALNEAGAWIAKQSNK